MKERQSGPINQEPKTPDPWQIDVDMIPRSKPRKKRRRKPGPKRRRNK